jgi:Cd2+/Zn2+-exporting ATPase
MNHHTQDKTTTNENLDTEHEEDSCLEVINSVTVDAPGVVGLNVDFDRQQMSVEYDAAQMSNDKATQISQQLAPEFQQRFETCTMRVGSRGGRSCESCALILEGKVGQLPGVRRAAASYAGGILSIKYDNSLASPEQLMRQVAQFGVRVGPSGAETLPVREVEKTPPSPLARGWRWLNSQSMEMNFTIITFVAMMTAWLAGVAGALPIVSTVLYIVAYATGGWFGLKAGIESLRERTIDIDLLMILAALGAAVIGLVFEKKSKSLIILSDFAISFSIIPRCFLLLSSIASFFCFRK